MLFFLFRLQAILCKKQLLLDTQRSLFGPPVDHNGLSPRYDFREEYAVTTFSSESISYTQLGYDSARSAGMIIAKEPLKSSNFCVDFIVKLIKSSESTRNYGKIVFFIAKDYKIDMEDTLNISDKKLCNASIFEFQGDAHGKAYIGCSLSQDFPVNNKEAKKKVDIDNNLLYEEFVIRVENINGDFIVSFGKKSRDLKELIKIKNNLDLKGHHIGVSSEHRYGTPLTRIYGIRFYEASFIDRSDRFEDVPVKKMSKLIWVLILVAGIIIGQHLFKSYKKYK